MTTYHSADNLERESIPSPRTIKVPYMGDSERRGEVFQSLLTR